MARQRAAAATPKKAENGTWGFVADIGVDPSTGKRKQARRRGFATKREAQDELTRLLSSVAEQTFVAPQRQTVGEFFEEWLATIEGSRQPSTWESYARNLRLHVVPAIGRLQLQQLDPGHLNRLYGDLRRGGRKDGKGGGLSPRTIRYVHTIIGAAMRDAVRWQRIVRSPAELAEPPRASDAQAPEMQTWSGPELARFLAAEEGSRYYPAFHLLATTGMRRGEALGLRWSDIDLEGGRLGIRQTLTVVKHELRFANRTKTGKGRPVDLDAGTVAVLKAWKARQAAERLQMGGGWHSDDGDLVFTLPDGRPYHPERFSREFDRRVARHELPRIRCHDLRHTWATLALAAGVPLKVVSERLGHATTAITADTYSHVTPSMGAAAAETVAGVIFGTSV